MAFSKPLALLSIAALAVAANAQLNIGSSVNAQFTGLSLGQTGTVLFNGVTVNVGVGKLSFDVTAPNSSEKTKVYSVCGDFSSVLDSGYHSYALTTTKNDGTGLGKAGALVNTFFDAANTKEKAAGLQLAVWKAIYDNSYTFSNTTGKIKASTADFGDVNKSGTALYYAAQYYNASSSGIAIFAKTSANGGQSQLTTAPVPEPASLAALGVGAAALIRRRRKSK